MVMTTPETPARMAPKVTRHELSSVYPVDKALIAELAADMLANGFDENFPILVKEIDGTQQVVDGFHRMEACRQSGTKPVFRNYSGSEDDALRLVLRANGNRRHLSKQQKGAAALLVNHRMEGTQLNADEIVKFSSLAPGTVLRYRTYTPDELAKIVKGQTAREVEEGKKHAKGKGKEKAKKRPLAVYTANSTETRRLGGLSSITGLAVPDLIKKIINDGLTEMEAKHDTNGNGK